MSNPAPYTTRCQREFSNWQAGMDHEDHCPDCQASPRDDDPDSHVIAAFQEFAKRYCDELEQSIKDRFPPLRVISVGLTSYSIGDGFMLSVGYLHPTLTTITCHAHGHGTTLSIAHHRLIEELRRIVEQVKAGGAS